MNPEYMQPGNSDSIIAASLFNSSLKKPLIIMSGEYEDLNGKVLQPQTELLVNLTIPKGYREYINETNFQGKTYLYVGLRDKDQADPFIYQANV